MATPKITHEVLDFLKQLKENNDRTWFEAHKAQFKVHETAVKAFYESLKEALNTHDTIDALKMFRIYRDVRFSNDKTPYQPHFAGSFSRLGAKLRGGYYLRIRPSESFMACGFWQPNASDLYRIRKEFELDASPFLNTINDTTFKQFWGELKGEELKTAPKGFDKDHPNNDLIRKKAFIFTHEFTDNEVMEDQFFTEVSARFKAIRPFFDVMGEILTTDLNGESVLV